MKNNFKCPNCNKKLSFIKAIFIGPHSKITCPACDAQLIVNKDRVRLIAVIISLSTMLSVLLSTFVLIERSNIYWAIFAGIILVLIHIIIGGILNYKYINLLFRQS